MAKETLVIGDVHGCAGELRRLLEYSAFDPARHRGICTGDLYTRGPDPRGVWHLLRRFRLEAVRGNHEDYLLDALPQLPADDPTLSAISPDARATARAFDGRQRSALLRALRDLPSALHGPRRAGSHEPAWIVVHAGIDPRRGIESSADPRTCTRIRYWPPGAPKSHHWHEFYQGETLLVFGHDAVGGLVEHRTADGRPRAIGIDTGCVYGGRLTGYWIERDSLVSVPAERAWWPIRS